MSEMSEYQRDQQRTARRGQGEKAEEPDGADQNAKHRRRSEGCEAEIVKFQQLPLELRNIARLDMRDLAYLLRHVGVDDARHELHEQHHADDTKEIGNAVADRDGVLILRRHCLLGRGERRGRRQRAGEKAGDDGCQLLGVSPALQHAADQNARDRCNAAGENDDKPQKDIGFEILLHILEEVRPGDEADRGDKEHQTEVFNDLQRLRGVVDLLAHKPGIEKNAEKAAVDQRDDKYAGCAEADAFDRDPSQNISERRNGKDGEHQEVRRIHCKGHFRFPRFSFSRIRAYGLTFLV